MAKNGPLVIVAISSAMLSAAVTLGASSFVRSSLAQTLSIGGVAQLLTQPLADLPGREVRISLLERKPGSSSPPHRHPGHHTFGFIIDGTYELGIDGQPTRILKAGDTFYEPPGALHSVSRNPNTENNVKFIVFMVADQKNPSTVLE
jgi:quercetin dioxygenase-like cupin family protein